MSVSRLEAFLTVPAGVTIAATTNAGGPTTVTLTAGTYTATTLAAQLATDLNAQRTVTAGTWTVSLSATGFITIAVTAGTFSITWTSTVARDALGFAASITSQSSATAPGLARGLWFPMCPLDLEGDPDRAPMLTDRRESISPSGGSIALKGTRMYRHRGLRWSHVSRALTWTGSATTTSAAFQTWWDDTQIGEGHGWFAVGAAFRVYWDNAGTARAVGYDLGASGPTNGWKLVGVGSIDQVVKKRTDGWLGQWSVEFPIIVSEG